MFNGEKGEVLERMFRLLVRLGEIYGEIGRAHV